MRTSGPVGRYEIALLNGEKIAVHGNIKLGIFCWFINGTFCQGEVKESWKKKTKLCRQCEVFRLIFGSKCLKSSLPYAELFVKPSFGLLQSLLLLVR